MGNNAPSQNISNSKNDLNKSSEIELNDDKIFHTISDISKKLFLEYNNEYLKNDFCSKISILYEKKLSQLNIKLLKNLHDKINDNKLDNELLMTIQYTPQNDEKFEDVNNFFSDNLRENFWYKNVRYNFSDLLNKNSNINSDKLSKVLKSPFNYINQEHVNNLLNNSNKKITSELLDTEKENNTINQVGGFIKKNNKNIKLFYNIKKGGKPDEDEFIPHKINKDRKPINLNKKSNKVNEVRKNINENANTNKRNNKVNEVHENLNANANTNKRNNKVNEVHENINANANKRTNKINEVRENINANENTNKRTNKINEVRENLNANANTNKRNNKINEVRENINANENANKRNNKVNEVRENINANENTNKRTNKVNEVRENLNANANTNKRTNKINEVHEKSNIVSKKDLNNNFNKAFIKSTKLDIPYNKKEDEVINHYLKYNVPSFYKYPAPLCNNKEKCKLTKKQFCQAISENFIVRNNIIAAILTTIPYKNSEGKYIGGVCYQKFLNLNDCKVCVPYGYKDLKNKKLKDIIGNIIEKADFLTADECKNNNGYFLELTQNQKLIFSKIIQEITPDKIEYKPSIQYNLYYVQLTNKLKNNYFHLLQSLIVILEKLENMPIINNKMLNAISIETKNIIDKLYNLCHYYYVYGIISLINSDLTSDILSKEDILQNSVKSALSKSNSNIKNIKNIINK
jgi:hypothetical protein